MATKKQLVARCRELGVMLLDSGDCVRIDAPLGKRFAGGCGHSRDIYTDGWSRSEVYEELLRELSDGIDDCDDLEEVHSVYGGLRLA